MHLRQFDIEPVSFERDFLRGEHSNFLCAYSTVDLGGTGCKDFFAMDLFKSFLAKPATILSHSQHIEGVCLLRPFSSYCSFLFINARLPSKYDAN